MPGRLLARREQLASWREHLIGRVGRLKATRTHHSRLFRRYSVSVTHGVRPRRGVERMAKKRDVETGFGLDHPDFPIVTAPDEHGITSPTLYTSELAKLKPWLEQWTVRPKFAFSEATPSNLMTFGRALQVVSCILFAYRIEAAAKRALWNDEAYFIRDDAECQSASKKDPSAAAHERRRRGRCRAAGRVSGAASASSPA